MSDDNIIVFLVGALIGSMKPTNQLKLVGVVILVIVSLVVVGLCLPKKDTSHAAEVVHTVSV